MSENKCVVNNPPVKCKQCGFKIRGENHNEGKHHAQGKPKK